MEDRLDAMLSEQAEDISDCWLCVQVMEDHPCDVCPGLDVLLEENCAHQGLQREEES